MLHDGFLEVASGRLELELCCVDTGAHNRFSQDVRLAAQLVLRFVEGSRFGFVNAVHLIYPSI